MPSIKKESVGNATIWTLRNNKGNELKVTDCGARIVSMRFCDKSYTNRFIVKDDAAGAVKVDGGVDFADILTHTQFPTAPVQSTLRFRVAPGDAVVLSLGVHEPPLPGAPVE